MKYRECITNMFASDTINALLPVCHAWNAINDFGGSSVTKLALWTYSHLPRKFHEFMWRLRCLTTICTENFSLISFPSYLASGYHVTTVSPILSTVKFRWPTHVGFTSKFDDSCMSLDFSCRLNINTSTLSGCTMSVWWKWSEHWRYQYTVWTHGRPFNFCSFRD